MKKPQTLSARIVFFFCGYLTILLLIFISSFLSIYRTAEDLVFERQLGEISEEIIAHIKEYNDIPASLPLHFSIYKKIEDIPQWLQQYVINREPGIYEIVGGNYNYHVSIVKMKPGNQNYYIFYNTGTIQSTRYFEIIMAVALLIIAIFVLFIGWFMAKSVSNRIRNPIIKLAHEVRSLSPDDLTTRLHYSSTKDEVGTLVNTINRLLERISDFTTREREFSSHASHELRTPVTVIKGAAEVIKNRSSGKISTIEKPLSRIERAVSDMEKLIETFLLLARQGEKPNEDERCDLSAVITGAVGSCRHILEGKPVEVTLIIPDSLMVQAPESLASIAVSNIVRNSFMYTKEGNIEISIAKDRIIVRDSGPGIDPAQQGKGLGLTIVKRLCERMDWKFNIVSHINKGTCAELVFN